MAKSKTKVKAKPSTRKVKGMTDTPTVKVARALHENAKRSYAGPSSGFNRSRSKTKIPVDEAGSRPDYSLSDRSTLILRDLRALYGNKPFRRLDADAAVLKYGLWKGHLTHVDGDPASELMRLQFTKAGMDAGYGSSK